MTSQLPVLLDARLNTILSRPVLRRAPRLADDIAVLVRDARRSGRQQLARELLPLLREAKAGDRQALLDAMGAAYAVLPPEPYDGNETSGRPESEEKGRTS